MGLAVAFLRMSMLFLNMYQTYKTLKTPPTSNRGRPSIRAMTQRKRDMKGCLAIWVVWCFFVLYERLFESVVCILVPFYSEIKSVVILFLMFTRARGAEPIFLYAIRPFIKPYASTLDAMLEIVGMFGDVAFVVAAAPFHAVLAWWLSKDSLHSDDTRDIARSNNGQMQSSRNALGIGRPPTNGQITRTPERSGPGSTTTTTTTTNADGYQIWHPPPQDPAAQEQAQSAPQLEPDTHMNTEGTPPAYSEVDEDWRAYPHFPSAYPPTPLVPSSSRVLDANDDVNASIVVIDPPYVSTPETEEIVRRDREWRQYAPFPSAYPPTPVVSHSQLVALQRSHVTVGNSRPQSTIDTVDEGDEEEEDGDQDVTMRNVSHPPRVGSTSNDDQDTASDTDDDDFNMTLKTPMPPQRRRSTRRTQHSPSRVSSRSTSPALTTTHGGSSLRTEDSSSEESSTSLTASDTSTTSSLPGRKRSYSHTDMGGYDANGVVPANVNGRGGRGRGRGRGAVIGPTTTTTAARASTTTATRPQPQKTSGSGTVRNGTKSNTVKRNTAPAPTDADMAAMSQQQVLAGLFASRHNDDDDDDDEPPRNNTKASQQQQQESKRRKVQEAQAGSSGIPTNYVLANGKIVRNDSSGAGAVKASLSSSSVRRSNGTRTSTRLRATAEREARGNP